MLLLLAAIIPLASTVQEDVQKVASSYDQTYSNLTPTERDFMRLLTPINQDVFCFLFDKKMRKQAIELTGQLNTNGDPMSADQAVQQVAQNNNIIIPLEPEEPYGAPSVQPD